MRHTALIASLVLSQCLAAQTTWYVDASAAPGGNGSAGSPFATIQSGVNAAANGDTVMVAPGTYPGVVISAKNIVLKSAQGPAVTGITSPNTSAMRITSTTSACVVEGFKLTNSHGPSVSNCGPGQPGGIDISSASPIIRRCIISNNVGSSAHVCPVGQSASTTPACAGGVRVGTGNPVLENCVIEGNTGGYGAYYYNGLQTYSPLSAAGGVDCAQISGNATSIRNCTITNNHGGGGALWSIFNGPGGVNGPATLVNSIVWGNTASSGGTPNISFVIFGINPVATWCDVEGGYAGAGNFSADPLFTADFRLYDGSPCIDAGTPSGATMDFDGVSRPQYLQPDIGAFEWRPQPGLTFTLSQPSAASVLVFTSGGTPGAVYVNLFTTEPANGGASFGDGRWGGLVMDESIVASQIGLGMPPFIGNLDSAGSASTSVPLPPGLTGVVVYAISHTLGATHVSSRSPVVAITLL